MGARRPQTVICAIHRDPAIWPRADQFVPERWLAGHAEEATDAQRRAFNPWGDGARACIGRRFAAEEGRIVLLRLYQRCAVLHMHKNAQNRLQVLLRALQGMPSPWARAHDRASAGAPQATRGAFCCGTGCCRQQSMVDIIRGMQCALAPQVRDVVLGSTCIRACELRAALQAMQVHLRAAARAGAPGAVEPILHQAAPWAVCAAAPARLGCSL